MDDGTVLMGSPVAILLVWWGRRVLDTRTRLPEWDRWLDRLWVPGALIFALGLFSRNPANWLDDVYFLVVLAIGMAVSWQLRAYRPARTVALGLAPYVVASGIEDVIGKVAPTFLRRYHDSFDLVTVLAVTWLITFLFIARNQRKALAAELLLRQQAADEQQRIEAQNQDLEHLVHQRTASLARQTNELRATLTELKETQTQLIQREKMASLGELTAGIAHEIQNPLNFVSNFSEVSAELLDELAEERARPTRDLALEAELLADLKQNLQRITQHGGRASGIVRGMLEHSRASTGERAPTDLNQLADEYLRLAYHGLRAKDKSFNAELKTDFAAALPPAQVISGDVGRVLLNLFTNAFYAVQKRQQMGEPGYAPTVGVATRRVGSAVEIKVTDNGTGIPAHLMERIFQPFFTTKPTGEGTGLGLSLSHDIITQGHGGTLRVESQEGQGTTFIITLPA